MYLSCLLINVGDNPNAPRPGREWLRNLYRVHQRLCMAFPVAERRQEDPSFVSPYVPDDFNRTDVHAPRQGESGFLFRVDSRPEGSPVILVQSGKEPDWDYAFQNANYLLAAPPETKLFEPRFQTDQLLRFRLRANPTRRVGKGQFKGQRVPVGQDDESAMAWFERKTKVSGCEPVDTCVTDRGWGHSRRSRDEDPMRFWSVLFEGVVRITDPDSFCQSISTGIGPAKAFGFGLLSVAPVR